MTLSDYTPPSRSELLEYFLQAAVPREGWQVGMEVEKMGRVAETGRPLDYDGESPSVRAVLALLLDKRGGNPVYEGDKLIGIDGAWGTISLEPGGQVEWSSRPRTSLDDLENDLQEHLRSMEDARRRLGVRWLDAALEPQLALADMPWMPKARYRIMGPYLGERGRLAHRMMQQTASIQCAYDYSDPEDWRKKFKAGALMAPVATALFANSSTIDGGDSGYRAYRQVIWRETDPDRCTLPSVVFEPDFSLEAWLDWILDVPTIFRHRARGLVPAGGVPFRTLMTREGCDAVGTPDWETHISTIFTDVRSYTYIEVRSADLPPDDLIMAVPAFWTGILYQADALEAALALGREFDNYESWKETMDTAARFGVADAANGRAVRDLAAEAVAVAIEGLRSGAACAGESGASVRALEYLASRYELRRNV